MVAIQVQCLGCQSEQVIEASKQDTLVVLIGPPECACTIFSIYSSNSICTIP